METRSRKRSFLRPSGKHLQPRGFVSIAHHGITRELEAELYDQVKKFFSLPADAKKKYEKPELAGQRGYTSKGKEKAKDSKTPDLKEFWQRGQTVTPGDPLELQYPDNIYVAELPRFNEITADVYRRLEFAGKYLLRAIAIYLGLNEPYFDDNVTNGNSILRCIHYFPLANPDTLPHGAVRAGAHEDINLITLLIGASADGLEILTPGGDWFPVQARCEDIVVNVGDMLQRITNNKLKSTTHRVVNPPRERMNTSRYSVPFFLHPKRSMDLTCLESTIGKDYPKQYSDMTAGAYLDERLREIGLKK
jgi:isopenicillin N synthase-like dioxygenase